ncbi:uncharacterized protein LOC134181923 isoform X2 [Corticium candelabrum]|uniref:uncharacterized protein LOC134181923 isoform X2 n=1 Tax=Corticium candelabrum TaxID=121492 RepID=UPI002E252632|nr:uncharacterized protein LOC134181923 isoform X2 [Corticium candelabrum]
MWLQLSVSELFSLSKELVSSDISIDHFHEVLLQYKYACFFRERLDGSLRGMVLIDPQMGLVKEGRRYNCIKMGLALFKMNYRGGPLVYLVAGYHLLKALIFYPHMPLYVLYKCFSYKSYLLSLRTTSNVYPRYDAETPEWEKSIIDEFGYSFNNKVDTYNPTTCVIHREKSRLKTHVAPITYEELENPNVRYFVEQNPFWDKGHCMVVLCHITWKSIFSLLFRAIRRHIRAATGRRRLDSTSRHHYHKQLSLQETLEQRRYSHIDPLWGAQTSSIDEWIPQSPDDIDVSRLELPDNFNF